MNEVFRSGCARRVVAALVAVVMLAVPAGCGTDEGAGAANGREPYEVGVFLIAQIEVFDDIMAGFREEFSARTGLTGDAVRYETVNAQGDSKLVASIARQLAAGDSDMFASIGTPAIISLASMEKRRPIIAVSMSAPVTAGVAKTLERPGGNVTGSTDAVPPALVADFLARVEPAPERVGVVLDSGNLTSKTWTEELKRELAAQGIGLTTKAVNAIAEVSPAARALAGDVDALVVGPDTTVIAAVPAVAAAAQGAGAQLYLTNTPSEHAPGVLAVLSPDQVELGRKAGRVAAAVYKGQTPAEVPFEQLSEIELTVDEPLARKLGVRLPDAVTE